MGELNQPALLYDSPVTDTLKSFTYRELLEQVARFAGVLANQGVQKGDRVIIYMPMVPEAVISMLACARIGAIHSLVFGGFAPNELAIRIDDAKPKLIVSAACGIEIDRVIPYKPLLDQAIEIASAKPERTIIFQRPQLEATIISGRHRMWAGSSDTLISFMRLCSKGVPLFCTRANLLVRPTPALSGGSSPSMGSLSCSRHRRLYELSSAKIPMAIISASMT